MKLLFATKNPAKVKRYKDRLEKHGIDVLTLSDIDVDVDVEENGENAIENAYIKAKAYYDKTGIVTIGIDDTLYIEEVTDEEQPGTNVRRVGGKRLTDEEMIDYYTSLAHKYGGELTSKWVYGMVMYDGKPHEFSWSKECFYIIDKASDKHNPGYPMDSISKYIGTDKYFVDMTREEKEEFSKNHGDEELIDFIIDNLKREEQIEEE